MQKRGKIFRKRVLLFLVVLLFVNIVSASYKCSSGDIITDSKIIYIGNIKSVNNINIALIMSSWESVAEILLDAKHITLTNTSSSKDIELLKNNDVTHGYWIRSQKLLKQIREVIIRFNLISEINPFSPSRSPTTPM